MNSPYAGNTRRVGSDVADMLYKLHVTKVVAGRFGHKFAAELQAFNIESTEQNGFATQVARVFSVWATAMVLLRKQNPFNN